MRALTLDFEQHKLREREVPEPVVQSEDEVLLRVRESGICGTDRELASFRFGYPPPGESFLVLGHEALAEVVTPAGALEAGDLVVPMVRRSCVPPCASCARGRRDLCLTGRYTERGIVGEHGYFAEFAVDRVEDLLLVPADVAEVAVLVEPLSVVEKAVAFALRLHQGAPEHALVLGAGTIGLLAAMVLQLRGLDVEVVSLEPPGSARARLVESAGAMYGSRPARKADVVIEAAGAAEALMTGVHAMRPLGVLMVLGAIESGNNMPLIDLILGNCVVAGSVNAGPEAFAAAVQDLRLMPRSVLNAMIERTGFSDYKRTILGPPPAAPKVVHVI